MGARLSGGPVMRPQSTELRIAKEKMLDSNASPFSALQGIGWALVALAQAIEEWGGPPRPVGAKGRTKP